MNKELIIAIFRQVTFYGSTSQKPLIFALVGLWRVILIACLLAVLGIVCSPVFIYLDIIPQSRSLFFDIFFYPMTGLAIVAFFAGMFGMTSAMIEMLVSLGKLGQVKE
ncbi:hypothetical protein KGP17_22770 [Serratia sp. JSRIV001]|uniref:hypothetical protein n=1 Tax=unclassified Serratia (in: enterobacteria) TaxID=2647522 RepID=UPI001CBC578D|nr:MULTISPECIES: hypothetical protein [unclassified Serratia (in: enterobacteria)]UAN45192.1 hypothetical protein KGP17_22770 [Serratia sp. JSRIV001]UAN54535.1 hypothetical protein KGP26_28470 [Serratia sp. JSRIV002]UAN60546.1 hypothetical protein KGP21_28805 [Serratia sp. JSRIV004]